MVLYNKIKEDSQSLDLLTIKEAASWLKVHPDRLRKDLNAGRINQNTYVKLSERQTRFIKKRLEDAVLEGNLYAPGRKN